ncbi:ArsR/SmtB family transcription factor, partial [Turicimonas muris]
MAEFPEVYEEQAKIFKALGHPARLMMVEAMLENPKTVTELTNMVQLEMPTVSRHLAVLKEAQVVKAQKKANSIIYSIEMTCLK